MIIRAIRKAAGAGAGPSVLGNRRFAVMAGLVWLSVVLTATFRMLAYANSAGVAGMPPSRWPEASQVARKADLPTLVMFVHPRCPCSRSSVGELALLMAHCQGLVNAEVRFLRPAGMNESWAQTDLWKAAAAIPGVRVQADASGMEAERFQAKTSGDTMLYSVSGELLFHGGITVSRGHAGDNAGRDALEALVMNAGSAVRGETPVFGCALFEGGSKEETGSRVCQKGKTVKP